MDDRIEDYRTSLANLTYNSKSSINELTMFAGDNETHATKIVEVIERHLQQVESTKKLPTLYLIDSIIKNLPKSTYPGLFSHNIVSIFCNMFEQVDEKTRKCMFEVRQTWNQHFTGRKMYDLDVQVNNIDNEWPLSTSTFNISPMIHANPKCLPQTSKEREISGLKASSSRNCRTRTRSSNSDSKSGSESKEGTKNKEDHDNEKSQIEEEKDRGKTQNVDNQRGKGKITRVDSDHDSRKRNGVGDDRDKGKNWSDSRNRKSKSPRLSHERSRSPVKDSGRGSKNPPRKDKAINELKNNNKKQMEEQPKLEYRKPISSLPRIPKRTGTDVDERVTEKDHDERRLSSSNKRDLDERHEYKEHEPVRTSKKPRISQERDVPTIEPVTVHTKMNEDIRMRNKPKDKKRADPRKSASDFRSKESKEREISESKASSSRNSRTRTRSSNNDSKSGSESKEGTKSKNKEDHDKGKSQIEEEKDHGKTQNVDNQRGKGNRTPIDHDSRKRNGTGDDREKGINWSDSSHARSRLPVKDSGRGSKNSRRKNKAINELKNNNNKQTKELPKLEHRKPISSLPRIPKRTGTDVDERVMEKDHDERRLSSSNKRDLDERHDYGEHEPVRTSKKPRISQERDVPTIKPVTVHTKMNEDISNLFGNGNQDYRHSDTVSPREGGWARYKADHPKDFDNRRSSLEDIDHRIERQPRDTDYRPTPYYRPPVKCPGYNEGGRDGPQPSDPVVATDVRLENRENLLRTIEMKSKSGKISHDDMQIVLRSLSEIDYIQEQRRHQPLLQDTPHLDYRSAPYYRPPVKNPGYNEGGRGGPQPSDPVVATDLRLENRENLSRTMEMKRKSGEISHDDMQIILCSLSQFDYIQVQRRHQPLRQDPPHLEPEIRSPRDDRYRINRTTNEPIMDYHSRRSNTSEPPMEFQSPNKEHRNLPHDADMRRADHPPVFNDLRREDGLPRGTPIDRHRDLDPTRAAERPQEDVHTYRESDRPSHRGTDRHKDDRLPLRGQDRPPHVRGRDFDEPGRLSLLGPGPGPRIRPEQDTVQNREPVMNYVKILDPIENQKLKDNDIVIKSSDRDRKGRNERGHSGRISSPLGQRGSQQTPVSKLDLNVPKPPGLKKDMNNDRRRGSPLNEERPRSPVRHRDRRKRSPHRERRSPDRRGRRYPILKDDRVRGSPINDQSNFNGPRNMPPFGPGQQGPSPQFNPVGQNQPFPQRHNQQFAGPNQSAFQQGPNQRFPAGPNQMQFPFGPNQPFQPGPNQQFPPGPNQQFSQEALSMYDNTGLADLEKKLISSFANCDIRWREGKLKNSFNYLLLDPRVTKNLPNRMNSLGEEESFKVFVAAIFYVGKGQRSRPISHLYEALSQMETRKPPVSDKVKHILDIWSENVGVIILQFFQNVIPVEAYTREACMVDALISLNQLTNQTRGKYYSISKTWSREEKRNMGFYFLKKALKIFKEEGERPLLPGDLKGGQ